MAYNTPSINKFFSETFPLYIHVKEVLPGHFNRVALPVTTTCCSDPGLTRMQILMNLICL